MKDPEITVSLRINGESLQDMTFRLHEDRTVSFEASAEHVYGMMGFTLSQEQVRGMIAWFKELEDELMSVSDTISDKEA